MSENLFIEPVAISVEDLTPHVDVEIADVDSTDYDNPVYDIDRRLIDIELQLGKLTDAVNNFGKMLDFIVGSVEGMANLVKDKGLAGIMGMAMGGGKNG